MINFKATTGDRSRGLINHLQRANALFGRSVERLTTGKRINRPSDDPSGFVAAEQLKGDLVELSAEGRAASYGTLQNAQQQSALAEIQRTVSEARGLLVTAADGFASPKQLEAIQQQLNASANAARLVAARVEDVDAEIASSTTPNELDVINGDPAAAAEFLDQQHTNLSRARAARAAYAKSSDAEERLRQDQIVITTDALSQIEDADFAEEASNLAVGRMLSKASAAALTFSNREQAKQIDALLAEVDDDPAAAAQQRLIGGA